MESVQGAHMIENSTYPCPIEFVHQAVFIIA